MDLKAAQGKELTGESNASGESLPHEAMSCESIVLVCAWRIVNKNILSLRQFDDVNKLTVNIILPLFIIVTTVITITIMIL